MGAKTIPRSPALPPVLTCYKLLEIEWATSLAFACRCSRLWLFTFAYTVSPTPVSVCIQAGRKDARQGGGADAMWSRGKPARPRADDAAVAGPRSSAPSAGGGASGRGRAALACGSCRRWWWGGGRILRRSRACQPKKCFYCAAWSLSPLLTGPSKPLHSRSYPYQHGDGSRQ